MSLCILASGAVARIATTAFMLSWTHSVEKIPWQEDWRVTPEGLQIVEARVKGSGAGMDPPENAVLENGWWRYTPDIPPRPSVSLAASGATVGGWTLCANGSCRSLGSEAGKPIVLKFCPDEGK
ncbi:DUF1850 domain-containing protein [Phyllobacterium salinisoli]|uniref:DUF1850 domain-containing protein n=1 Tax=Phyllobacterium salinisoli TaxID=1899321 RepID=A0A368K1B0_9HYPH|nr:DUF1850 domain-containing protein [Phyllobacterium salinisoli]RCS23001.1 DUF1850 domain-containing protein [Phyllobacterium salinisoli]